MSPGRSCQDIIPPGVAMIRLRVGPTQLTRFPHANEAPFAIALWPCSRSAVGKRYRLPNP